MSLSYSFSKDPGYLFDSRLTSRQSKVGWKKLDSINMKRLCQLFVIFLLLSHQSNINIINPYPRVLFPFPFPLPLNWVHCPMLNHLLERLLHVCIQEQSILPLVWVLYWSRQYWPRFRNFCTSGRPIFCLWNLCYPSEQVSLSLSNIDQLP